MAVKLYEKDPSKLTASDETLPAVSTGSDIRQIFLSWLFYYLVRILGRLDIKVKHFFNAADPDRIWILSGSENRDKLHTKKTNKEEKNKELHVLSCVLKASCRAWNPFLRHKEEILFVAVWIESFLNIFFNFSFVQFLLMQNLDLDLDQDLQKNHIWI
jgi:hypothetical protein